MQIGSTAIRLRAGSTSGYVVKDQIPEVPGPCEDEPDSNPAGAERFGGELGPVIGAAYRAARAARAG